jgi:hypothetical protein
VSTRIRTESPSHARGGLSFLLAIATGFAVPLTIAYKSGPPAGHTGGFGEPTCHACHADDELNPAGGALAVVGFPAAWAPGATDGRRVRVRGEDLGRGGFQMAIRFAGDPSAGKNAGQLKTLDTRASVTTAEQSGVQYAQHLLAGVTPLWSDSTEWTVRWTAPAQGSGPVVLHVAANASNDDESEYGDRIYNTSLESAETRKD